MVFFSNEWCKECIKWSQFFCRARREGAMRWVMRMRSVRENKETVNNHTARWSKLLFGCVKYRKKNLFVFFSCFPKKEKLHAQKRSDCSAALQNNLIVIWSLTQSTCMSATSNVHDNTFYEQWNCQYSPRQFVSFINNFVFTFFFSIYERKLKLRGRLVWMFVTVPWLMNNLLLILSLCILFYRRSAYKYVVYSQRSQQARQQQQLPPLRYALHPNTFS